jgi:hypothetical protein
MIKVIDNVISDKYSQFLFDRIANVPWTFVPNLSYGQTDNYDSAGFSYSFFLHENYNQKEKKHISTPEYNYIIPLLLEGFTKFNLNLSIEQVFRCRARLTLNRETSKIEDKHIDYNFPHLVFLYYINTTDGNTVLYENDQIIEQISPKRGRGVLFDGKILHASSSSTLSPRIVLNTNILL